ncbi:hypothetical protein F4777DRAFT_235669 [Nemania sp. FL0916]|nr:hypothetical protein F4777DRAFT_235669 [Nemania sp. FL0916]
MRIISHSDLEVVPGTAPQIIYGDPPEVAHSSDSEAVPSHEKDNSGDSTPTKQGRRRICGLSTGAFLIVLGIFVWLITLGGTVGGILGGLHSKDDSDGRSGSPREGAFTSPSSTILNTPLPPSVSIDTTPTTTTPQVSTTTVTLPSTTLYRDCPSSNGTLYNVTYGSEEPLIFRKLCEASFRHVVNFNDLIMEPKVSLNDCINTCADYNNANKTAIASGGQAVCNAVCWWTNEHLDVDKFQVPGRCWGYTAMNTSTGWSTVDEVYCDSAIWINQRDL